MIYDVHSMLYARFICAKGQAVTHRNPERIAGKKRGRSETDFGAMAMDTFEDDDVIMA
jgi:hypothetical protein